MSTNSLLQPQAKAHHTLIQKRRFWFSLGLIGALLDLLYFLRVLEVFLDGQLLLQRQRLVFIHDFLNLLDRVALFSFASTHFCLGLGSSGLRGSLLLSCILV